MTDDGVDLSNCDREPIRIPGAIQPHGTLIAIGVDDPLISHACANLAEFFGIGPEAAIGRPLSRLIHEPDYARMAREIEALEDRDSPRYLYTVRPEAGGAGYDAIVHRSGDRVILEFEPMRGASGRRSPTCIA